MSEIEEHSGAETPEGAVGAADDAVSADRDAPAPERAPKPDSSRTESKGGALLATVALLLAGIAMATAGYLWWQTKLETSSSARDAGEQQRELDALREDLRVLRGELANAQESGAQARTQMSAELQALAGLEPRLNTAEQAISSLTGSSASARRAWIEAEVVYLLQIANTRLRLASDVEASVAALEAADERLRVLDQPRLLEVRDALAADLQALRSLPRLDTAGIALKLGALAGQVDRLPLKNALPGDDAATAGGGDQTAGWSRAKAVLSGALKNMVSVRRADEAVIPLLAPKDEFLLRRNLELQLLSARLAALRADTENYDESLRDAKRWLSDYFDGEHTTVSTAITTIESLQSERVDIVAPDISGSLSLLRQLTVRAE